MAHAPVAHRRHAIFKHHYRRVVAATPGFHELDVSTQWQLLRNQVQVDPAPKTRELLAIMDDREPRREQVIAALEQARQEGSNKAASRRRRGRDAASRAATVTVRSSNKRWP